MIDPATRPSSTTISAAFLSACEAELTALKPGNVHIFAPGHAMEVGHFRAAASAAAPHVADHTRRIGARIKSAVTASMAAAGCNTNLGILLLAVPLVESARLTGSPDAMANNLKAVLSSLDRQDTEDIYEAIRTANPGGLGAAEKGDVREATDGLEILDAMRLAADRDRIAAAFCNGFADIFNHHLPVLKSARAATEAANDVTASWAVTMLHMHILQDYPDSHIQRKFDPETASRVQHRAAALRSVWQIDQSTMAMAKRHKELLAFDGELKAEGLNPGTTADFVVATLFADLLGRPFDAHESPKDPCPSPPRGAI